MKRKKGSVFKTGTITIRFSIQEREILEIISNAFRCPVSAFLHKLFLEWVSNNKEIVKTTIEKQRELDKFIKESTQI